MQTGVLDKFLYVDDMVDNAKIDRKLKGPKDRVSQACGNYNLTISTKYTSHCNNNNVFISRGLHI